MTIALLLAGFSKSSVAQEPTDFRVFIRDYFESTEFQLSHTKFPLEVWSYTQIDASENSELTSKSFYEADWKFMEAPEQLNCGLDCYDLVFYDSFEKSQSNSGERVLSLEGVENGIDVSMYFQWIEDQWTLVKIIDLSN